MENRTYITYWLSPPGECNEEIEIFSTVTSKVPTVGEVINFNTQIDMEMLKYKFDGLGSDWNKFLPSEDKQIKGDFLVVSVKRWLKTYVKSRHTIEWMDDDGNKCSSKCYNPMAVPDENFEVFVEPFRHTELTETSIAKLRNMMGPIYGYFQLLKAFNEMKGSDSHKSAARVLLEDTEKQAIDSIEDVVNFIKDEKNW